MPQQDELFDRLVAEAQHAAFSGWDFSYLGRRWLAQPPPWDYREQVLRRLPRAHALLDMGTGGGEFLSKLAPLPPTTIATEAYSPNIPVARALLEPLGISVVEVLADDRLPFPDERFDLIINRHDSFSAPELYRVLQPGGVFVTQQVGGQDNVALNERLQEGVSLAYADWNLQHAVFQLEQAGFEILEQREAFPSLIFYDIGAVVYYLKAIPWQIADFTIERYHDRLLALHHTIEANGELVVQSHRFFIEAHKR